MSIVVSAKGYDIRKTMTCGQVFRYSELPGGLFQVLSRNKVCKVWTADDSLAIDCDERDNDYWVRYFNVSVKDADIQSMMSVNAIMRDAYEFSKGVRLLLQDPFECLIEFIISQQKRIPQIQATMEKLCKACGDQLGPDLYGFPDPEAITPDVVDSLRVGYRAPYIYNAAQEVASGDLILEDFAYGKVSYQSAMQRLQRLPGVGVKVADCVALFALGFPQAFPVDTHIKQLLAVPCMRDFRAEAYGEYAGLIQQHMYYYALHNGY